MKRLVVVALTVFGLCAATQSVTLQAQAAKAKSMTASGTVKEVSGSSLTVTTGGKDMTFTVDGTTKFIGKGLSTKTREKGGKITATDAVGNGDMVSVTYHDMGGTMHAAQVRVNNKALAPKK
jgi:predicted transcriptional regulator